MESICIIKDIYRTLNQYEKDFHRLHGITINETMLLCCLKDGKEKTAGELCEYIALSNSRVSKVITSAEGKGLISRCLGERDKRQMLFSLTEKGRGRISAMQQEGMGLTEFFNRLRAAIPPSAGKPEPIPE